MIVIKKFKDIPWPNPAYQDMWYASYDAPRPRSMGHKIYVPKETGVGFVNAAFHAAYAVGTAMVSMNRWSGFKLLMEYGEAAKPDLIWPLIHLIPIPPEIKE